MKSSYQPKKMDIITEFSAKMVHELVPVQDAESVAESFKNGVRHFEQASVALATAKLIDYLKPHLLTEDNLQQFLVDGFFSEQVEYQILFDYLKLKVLTTYLTLLKDEERNSQLIAELSEVEFNFLDEISLLLSPFEKTARERHVELNRLLFADLTQKFMSIKADYPVYDIKCILVNIYKRTFSIGQIPLLDDIIYSYFTANKASILSGERKALSDDLGTLVDFDEFNSTRRRYNQMKYLSAAIACEYAGQLKQTIIDSAEFESHLVSSWVRDFGLSLEESTCLTDILSLLTILYQQDQLRTKACEAVEIASEIEWNLTLKLARLFSTAFTDKTALNAVLALLPDSVHESFSNLVKSSWPQPVKQRQLRRSFGMFDDVWPSNDKAEDVAKMSCSKK